MYTAAYWPEMADVTPLVLEPALPYLPAARPGDGLWAAAGVSLPLPLAWYGWPQVRLVRYRVRRGDSLYTIARRHGVSLRTLIAFNPHVLDPDVLRPGDVVMIPYLW